MLDKFDREIDYLRISLTDKCNLRCTYCLPEEGVALRKHEEFLSLEQIAEVVRVGVGLGLKKIRLTGGEPLVKKGIVDLVRMIKSINGVEHLAMTTNGVLLEKYARELKKAGLDSVNISIDTLDPVHYRALTRLGDIRFVLRGIEAALRESFPVKINMVVLNDMAEGEIENMRAFCLEKGFKLQLINHYSLNEEKLNDYCFERPPKCRECNRIRLLADGQLKSCLHSDKEIKLDPENIEAGLRETIENKPEKGSVCLNRNMMEIGG